MQGGSHEATDGRWQAPLLVAAGLLLLLATRGCHPLVGLGNADIAGIFYEADVIVDGGVPYVDTIDMKPPGTFFLVAAIFNYLGRSVPVVAGVYLAWAALAGPAIWIAAKSLYGRRDTAAAAVLLYLAWIGTFDFNYSAWMTTMYAWAFACVIAAIRSGRPWLHLAAGTCAALALTLKGHAVVLAPVFALVWLWGRRNGEPGATWIAWPLWLVGAALGFAPLVGWFAAHGATDALMAGLVPIAEARVYAGRIDPEDLWLLKIWRIPLQHIRVFPLHSLLVGAVLVGAWWRRRAERGGDVPEDRSLFAAPLAPQLIFWSFSVVGCGLGGWRFYVHYLPQYLPALALLAVHPLGLGWWRARGRAGWWLIGATVVMSTVLVVRIPLGLATNIDYRGSKNADKVGAYINARTRPDETILVWGWAAWATYFYADRRSPSAIFKVLGQVTEYNQNGMFTRSKSADFKPGPYADLLLADMKKAPPAYIIKTPSFFPGVKLDPMRQWPAMQQFVSQSYTLAQKFGRIRLFELKARRRGGRAAPVVEAVEVSDSVSDSDSDDE